MSCLMEFLHLLNWHTSSIVKALPSTNLPFLQLHRHLTINLNINSDFFLYSWHPNLTYHFNFESTCFCSLLSFSNRCCCDRLSARFKTREVAIQGSAKRRWLGCVNSLPGCSLANSHAFLPISVDLRRLGAISNGTFWESNRQTLVCFHFKLCISRLELCYDSLESIM